MKTPIPSLQPVTWKWWKQRHPKRAAKLMREQSYPFSPEGRRTTAGSALYFYGASTATMPWECVGTSQTDTMLAGHVYSGGSPDPKEYRP